MIYIEPIRVKWEPGVKSGKNNKAFETYIAWLYVLMVQKRVEQQKFKYKWEPLSPYWKQYKAEHGLSPKTWKATGELIQNLYVKNRLIIGFDNRRHHGDTKETLLSISRKLEYGTSKIPARPLFRLVYWYMSKHINYFYERYLNELKKYRSGSEEKIARRISERVFRTVG